MGTHDTRSARLQARLTAASSQLDDLLDGLDLTTADHGVLESAWEHMDSAASYLHDAQRSIAVEPETSRELAEIIDSCATGITDSRVDRESPRLLRLTYALEAEITRMQTQTSAEPSKPPETFPERATRELSRLRSILEGLDYLSHAANRSDSTDASITFETLNREADSALAIAAELFEKLQARLERES